MDIISKPDATPRLPTPAVADIQPQSAALAPLIKPCSHLELTSLAKTEEFYKPQPAALENVAKTRAFIQAKPANQA